MAVINQDLSNIKADNFAPLPEGEYPAHIVGSEVTYSKAGDQMLTFTYAILEGDHQGRLVFDRHMLTGSEKAVEIGAKRLKGLASAVGLPNPNYVGDSAELHGRPLTIKLKIEKGQNGYEDQSRISAFKPLAQGPGQAPAMAPGAMPPPPAPAYQVPPPPPAAAGQTPPPPLPAGNSVTAEIGYNQAAMAPGPTLQHPAPGAVPPPAPGQKAPWEIGQPADSGTAR